SLYLLFSAFPRASIAILPTAQTETPPDPPPFRHTTRWYPNVPILAPLFDAQGRATLSLICRLASTLSELVHFDRKRRNSNSTLEWIRNSDLVVSVGGRNFRTYGNTFRDDARFMTRLLPLLAAQKIDVPTAFVGSQIGPFKTRLGARL